MNMETETKTSSRPWQHRFAFGLLVAVAGLFPGCITASSGGSSFSAAKNAGFLVDEGTSLMKQGELKRAEASFKLALEVAPLAAAYDGLGCIAFLQGDMMQARQLFIIAYDMDPSYERPLANLGLTYEAEGDTIKAREFYETALRKDPRDFMVRNNYAALLQANAAESKNQRETLMRRDQVLELLLQAEALSPHPLIKKNLERIWNQ